MPPSGETSSVVTNCKPELHVVQNSKVVWPCNANRDTHEGRTYASQHARRFTRETEDYERRKTISGKQKEGSRNAGGREKVARKN